MRQWNDLLTLPRMAASLYKQGDAVIRIGFDRGGDAAWALWQVSVSPTDALAFVSGHRDVFYLEGEHLETIIATLCGVVRERCKAEGVEIDLSP